MTDTSECGILLAVEGIDGAGKTTQVDLLADALRIVGEKVVTSKEPTNGKWGKKIRRTAEKGRLPLRDELDTFIRDRQQHVRRKIAPALKEGAIVILDRYFYSTIAYQGSRPGGDWQWLDRQMKSRAPVPDLVYVLDVDPVVSLARIETLRGDSPNEFERIDGLQGARSIFQRLCEIDPVLLKIDASMSIKAVQAQVLGALIMGPLWKKRCAKSYGCHDPFHCVPRITGRCDWIRLAQKLMEHLDEKYRPFARVTWPSQPSVDLKTITAGR